MDVFVCFFCVIGDLDDIGRPPFVLLLCLVQCNEDESCQRGFDLSKDDETESGCLGRSNHWSDFQPGGRGHYALAIRVDVSSLFSVGPD